MVRVRLEIEHRPVDGEAAEQSPVVDSREKAAVSVLAPTFPSPPLLIHPPAVSGLALVWAFVVARSSGVCGVNGDRSHVAAAAALRCRTSVTS